jgi:hypothetical protein
MKRRIRHLILLVIFVVPGLSQLAIPPAMEAESSSASKKSATQDNRSVVGEWGPLQTWNHIPGKVTVPVHINLLPDGRVLYWGRDKATTDPFDVEGRCNTFIWDSLHNITKLIPNNTTNLFCSGHSFLPDGRLLVSGGHKRVPGNPALQGNGETHLNIFDYKTDTWTKLPTQMEFGRWYPYNVTLATGETLIVGGSFADAQGEGATNDTLDVFVKEGQPLRRLPDEKIFPLYPFMHLVPSGEVLVSGNGSGQFHNFIHPSLPQSFNGSVLTNSPHDVGTAVLYDSAGKVLIVGGRKLIVLNDNPSTTENIAINTAEVLDINNRTSAGHLTARETFSMNFPRMHFNSTLLPDGKVLVTGGSQCSGTNSVGCSAGPAQSPELWNPATEQWTVMAATNSGVPRVYHSVALLLPDGRVLVGGGGLPAATGENIGGANFDHFGHNNIEIFSPPYLFDPTTQNGMAKRPAIIRAPSAITYGQSFDVNVGNIPSNEISKVVLVRLGSVTHGFNQDQRRVVLSSSPNGEHHLTVTAPDSANRCPPGPYMLFVLNQNGTPSIAKILTVGTQSLSRDSQAFPGKPANPSSSVMNGSVQIIAQPGISWQVTNVPGWVNLTSSSSGTGNATVTFSISNNSETASRKATLTIAGRPFTIYQGFEFSDVPVSHPLHDIIGKLAARGVTAGCGTDAQNKPIYCPDASVTREQMAVFILSALGIVPPANQPNPFTDVTPDRFGLNFIIEMAKRGITSGCGSNLFCPDNPVTRDQMAVFIEIGMGVTSPPTTNPLEFTDVTLSHMGVHFINDFKRRGLTSGCGSQIYCPFSLVDRGMMAVFLVGGFDL